jgi:thiosulfate/3-mercaptopyruvate sulfurtransferase
MAEQTPAETASAPGDPRAHLFAVRLWWEPDACGATGEWRGSVEHIATRERRYFRDLAALAEFVGGYVGWRARPPPRAPDDRAAPAGRGIANRETTRGGTTMAANGYANPHALIETEEVAARLGDPALRLVEVDVDTTAYAGGHIPGAVGWDWRRDLQRRPVRDIPTGEEWAALLGRAGIGDETAVVLYGDNHNWFAAFAYWLFKLYGHEDVRLMNGGRQKWLAEDRPLTTEIPAHPSAEYRARPMDARLRARRDQVQAALDADGQALVDVRSPGEFSGELLAPENLPQEGAQRGGHIPGARNIPWATAVTEAGTFKPAGELREIYGGKGITPERSVIAYCRIGERSAHTWFALTELLGYPDVRNYDGSWTEWGSLVGAPIEAGTA